MSENNLNLYLEVVDPATRSHTQRVFRERGVHLPTFAHLADPSTIPDTITAALSSVDPDVPEPLNLWRVHWYNDVTRAQRTEVPGFLLLPGELTGVEAPILMALGNRFPMIRSHKVLAAYACLAPRIVTGMFDPHRDRAVWPSTGNYARGGVAISRIMGCRGVAVLPEGMSQERFEWLSEWTAASEDVIRTPGTESNVKEIYDACRILAADHQNVIINQFSELANYLIHYRVTGPALAHVFEHATTGRLAAFVAASGSSGTLGAGDYLKEKHGSRIVPVEALECPTMLYNGYGEHNIQGIGDKHIPLIHNVGNSDDVIGISDRATDALLVLFNTATGKELLRAKGVPADLVEDLRHLGLSSICNLVASIRLAKYHNLGARDVVVTVATDGAEMYGSEIRRIVARDFGGEFSPAAAEITHARYLDQVDIHDLVELTEIDRRRIFNLGYYTWVEQQGVAFEDFEQRRRQEWWRSLHQYTDRWDAMINDFNQHSG